jgi:hypothetical protein
MADDSTSKLPNLPAAITFITVVTFVASLLYIWGLGTGLGVNLFGLCDLADYLRIAPSRVAPGLGFCVLFSHKDRRF